MRKVALIVPDLEEGGIARVAAELSRELSKRAEVYMILYRHRVAQDHAGTVVCAEIPYHFELSTDPNLLRSQYTGRASRIAEVKRNLGVDVSLSLSTDANVLNVLSRERERVVLSVHSYLSLARAEKQATAATMLLDEMIRQLYPLADDIVALTPAMQQDLVGFLGRDARRMHVIPGALELARVSLQSLAPLEPAAATIFGQPTIVTVGTLRRIKGQRRVIEAFARVKLAHPLAQLVLLGEGPSRGELADLIAERGLQEDAHLLGWKSNPFPYVARAQVFALPSHREGFPLALLEALQLGVAPVAMDCPSGPHELLAPAGLRAHAEEGFDLCTYGVLIPSPMTTGTADDAESTVVRALADAMSRLLRDDALRQRYRELGPERASGYDVGKIWRLWEPVLVGD